MPCTVPESEHRSLQKFARIAYHDQKPCCLYLLSFQRCHKTSTWEAASPLTRHSSSHPLLPDNLSSRLRVETDSKSRVQLRGLRPPRRSPFREGPGGDSQARLSKTLLIRGSKVGLRLQRRRGSFHVEV